MDFEFSSAVKTSVIITVAAFNIVTNVLVIAVIARYPQLRVDRSTLFIFSLTISDLANGCTAMPISAMLCASASDSAGNIIKMHRFFSRVFLVVSLHSMCWVTVSKMVAIMRPLQCEQMLSRKRCYIIIALTWTFCVVMTSLGSRLDATWNHALCFTTNFIYPSIPSLPIFGLIIGIAVPLFVTVYASARIFVVIVKTHLRIRTQVNSIGGVDSDASTDHSLTLQSIRSGRNILLICAAALILTLPMLIYALGVVAGIHTPASYQFASVWIVMCNSSANGIIYLTVFRTVRMKLKHMLRELITTCN